MKARMRSVQKVFNYILGEQREPPCCLTVFKWIIKYYTREIRKSFLARFVEILIVLLIKRMTNYGHLITV